MTRDCSILKATSNNCGLKFGSKIQGNFSFALSLKKIFLN